VSSVEASMGVSDGPRRVATAPGLLITQRSEVQINPATRRDGSPELIWRAVFAARVTNDLQHQDQGKYQSAHHVVMLVPERGRQ